MIMDDLGINKQAILSRRVDSLHDALNPAPFADHRGPGHVVNLAGQHRGNRYCTTCQVPVGMPEFDEDQVSASVEVSAVVVGPVNTIKVRQRLMLRAFLTTATSPSRPRMQLTRAFTATVKGFNESYGAKCKSWDQVAQCAHYLLSLPVDAS